MDIEPQLQALQSRVNTLEKVVQLVASTLGEPILRQINSDLGFRFERRGFFRREKRRAEQARAQMEQEKQRAERAERMAQEEHRQKESMRQELELLKEKLRSLGQLGDK